MKIAIIQLARFGDVLMMWPLVRAIKRTYPGCHITMVAKENFKNALVGLDQVDTCVLFPSRYLLEPLLGEEKNLETSQQRLRGLLSHLKDMKFDWVINSTFSPLSADLTYFLEKHGADQVTGYSRFADGYLKIHGSMANYFYAQVGVDRYNRWHLLEIFSKMLHLQYEEGDFNMPEFPNGYPQIQGDYFTIHVGASEAHKALDPQLIAKFLNCALTQMSGKAVLIGSAAESDRARQILLSVDQSLRNQIIDLCGKTSFTDLFGVLKNAVLHFGGDSLPVQISLFTKTQVLMLSFLGTNFFETGPLAPDSCVLRYDSQEHVRIDQLVHVFHGMWTEETIIASENLYLPSCLNGVRFQNSLHHEQVGLQPFLEYLSFGEACPNLDILHDDLIQQGIRHLHDANEIVLFQLQDLLSEFAGVEQSGVQEKNAVMQKISLQVDQIFATVASYHPLFACFVRWVDCLKSQVTPGTYHEVIQGSYLAYYKIQKVLAELLIDNATVIPSRLAADFEADFGADSRNGGQL